MYFLVVFFVFITKITNFNTFNFFYKPKFNY